MWKTIKPSYHNFHGGFTYIFYFTSVITLTLLVPLSFLLLARLSTANYFLSSTHTTLLNHNRGYYYDLISLLFLYTSPTLLHFLVAGVTLSAFVHTLSGHPTVLPAARKKLTKPRLHLAWIFLCVLQVCVGLGIEASVSAGVSGRWVNGNDDESGGRSMFSRVVFFIGLHETMQHWSRMVVKPVVDDTVYGGLRDEKWVERVGMAVACGWLWMLRLRDEVESLVGVVEGRMMSGDGAGIGDFVGWWLYYLTVTIGVARVIKGLLWVVMVMFCRRLRDSLEAAEMEEEDDDDGDVLIECALKV